MVASNHTYKHQMNQTSKKPMLYHTTTYNGGYMESAPIKAQDALHLVHFRTPDKMPFGSLLQPL